MITCAVFGDRNLYENDVADKVVRVLKALPDNKIEIFSTDTQGFDKCVLEAARKYREENPSLEIGLTVIKANAGQLGGYRIPLYDRQVILDPFVFQDFRRSLRITTLWMLERADIALCYVYPELLSDSSKRLHYAEKAKKVTIINLAASETKRKIQEIKALLPDNERYVYEQICAGRTRVDVAKELGVKPPYISRIVNRACVRIRWTLADAKKSLR